jgi:hypothetical protein
MFLCLLTFEFPEGNWLHLDLFFVDFIFDFFSKTRCQKFNVDFDQILIWLAMLLCSTYRISFGPVIVNVLNFCVYIAFVLGCARLLLAASTCFRMFFWFIYQSVFWQLVKNILMYFYVKTRVLTKSCTNTNYNTSTDRDFYMMFTLFSVYFCLYF